MASRGTIWKKLPLKKKAYLFGIISFFAILLVSGIKAAYAYYYDSSSLTILSNLIGDFDTGDADINLMIYKETAKDSNLFTRSYGIPAVGYKLNDSLTTCTKPCDDNLNKNCPVTCNDSISTCYYTYNDSDKSIALTSSHKVTCKYYFEQEATSDINVYVMKEDVNGTHEFNDKYYSLSESIPAYGFKYNTYTCENAATVSYDSELKKFNVSTQTKNTCYAYFDSNGSADIVVNVYVQSSEGSSTYTQVETIPANKKYVLSTTQTSKCIDANGALAATPTYEEGYINITASEKQTCDVYLDLATE